MKSTNENKKYGLNAADFVTFLSGVVFACIAIGTTIVGVSNYDASAFHLLCNWTIGAGVVTWLLLMLNRGSKTADS